MQEERSIVRTILDKDRDKLIVIGVDGLSRSGKTTYVKDAGDLLKENHIDYVCLHMDDFIERRKKRYHTGLDEWKEYYYLQWNVENLRNDMFSKLKSSTRLTLQYYDDESDVHTTKELKLPSSGVILIEGVFLQRKEWKGYFDYLIYLDCGREARFRRENESTQAQLEKFKKRYWKAEDYYLQNIQPLENADYVIMT
ncbi:kinase [Rossellomorea sp. NS-SX7]|uniref:kinase n=1 Tax=Rossellomorea sp. NS-SX7 TaxID=3463856 RepID=UPI00405893D1